LVGIENMEHLLRPGMNGEVELDAGRRSNVIAIPNAALRTQRDVASAAQVLGLDPSAVQSQLSGGGAANTGGERGVAQAAPNPAGAATDSARAASTPAAAASAGETMTLPNGSAVTLPPGVKPEHVRAAMSKRMSGQEPTPAERALLRQVFAGSRSGGGGSSGWGGGSGGGGGNRRRLEDANRYIVFAMRDGRPTPVPIETGLTNLDYIEVTSGLADGDTILLLPSASLLQQQRDFRERFQRMSGGGLPGVQQQQQQGGGQRPQGR